MKRGPPFRFNNFVRIPDAAPDANLRVEWRRGDTVSNDGFLPLGLRPETGVDRPGNHRVSK